MVRRAHHRFHAPTKTAPFLIHNHPVFCYTVLMVFRRFSLIGLGLAAAFLPSVALALEERTLTVNTGVRISLEQLFNNVYSFAATSIVSICTLLFLVGAGYMVASHGKQEMVESGKKIMIGSLIGLAIVLGSYAILRTLFAILY